MAGETPVGTKRLKNEIILELSANSDVPYFATLAEAIQQVAVGRYFKTNSTDGAGPHPNKLWFYKRVLTNPFYEAMLSGSVPVTTDILDETKEEIENQIAKKIPMVETLAAFKALPAEKWAVFSGSLWSWTPVQESDPPFVADGANVIFSDSEPTGATGAWMRQSGEGIVQRQSGAGAIRRSIADKFAETISVKDFGAIGDGTVHTVAEWIVPGALGRYADLAALKVDYPHVTALTDSIDWAAIQGAINSGAGLVTFPRGRYRLSRPLTLANWIHLKGECFQAGIGVGSGAVVLQWSAVAGDQVVCGYRPLLENLVFYNSGGSYNTTTSELSNTTATCIKLQDDATIRQCSFMLWYKAIQTGVSSYYTRTDEVEFNRCTIGYFSEGSSPYDLDIRSPISRLTKYFFLGDNANPARDLKITGGSIEGYQSVINGGCLDVSLTNVYYETVPERETPGTWAVDPQVHGASVTMTGCTVYMNHTKRFVNMSGLNNCRLTGVGNRFTGVADAESYCYYLPNSGTVHLAGDAFEHTFVSTCRYVDGVASAVRFNGIIMPVLPDNNVFAAFSGVALVSAKGMVAATVAAEPSVKTVGLTIMADGDGWDPLNRTSGRPYWVEWQGDRWAGLDGRVATSGQIPDVAGTYGVSYVQAGGGATIDAEARTAQHQLAGDVGELANDVAVIRNALNSLLLRARIQRIISP